MRNRQFVTEHRGGSLKREEHIMLMQWACECAEKSFELLKKDPDNRLLEAIKIAKKWSEGNATVGEARNASVNAIRTARESKDPVSVALACAVGHAVATAHMADHSLGAALYALKAVNKSGRSVTRERTWQNSRVPDKVKNIVLSERIEKEKHFRL